MAPACLSGPRGQCSPFQSLCPCLSRVPDSPYLGGRGLMYIVSPQRSNSHPPLYLLRYPPARIPSFLPLSQPCPSLSGHLLPPIPGSSYHPHGLCHPHLPGSRPLYCGNDCGWQRILEPSPHPIQPPTSTPVMLTHARSKIAMFLSKHSGGVNPHPCDASLGKYGENLLQ